MQSPGRGLSSRGDTSGCRLLGTLWNRRVLSPCHRLDLGEIGPPDAQGLAVVELDRPHTETIVAQPGNPVLAQYGGAVDADEFCRIEPFFQAGDSLQQQVCTRGLVRTDMQAHIVALGIDPAHFRSGDSNELGTMGDPQLLQPGAVALFAIAAAVTAVLSLDATVVLLTPVVLATARTLGVPARPHTYATAHLANSASLLLPVSNLTNLLAFSAAGLSFLHFTAVMALPWLAVVAIEYLILRRLFAKDLAVAPRPRAEATPAPWPRFTLVVLALTLAGFALTSLAGLSPAWAALAGALVLGIRGLATGRTTVPRITVAADGPFLVFVLCLGVVVDAVMRNGLESAMQQILPDGTGLPALLWIAAVAAILSNVVNNLPAVLVLLPLVAAVGQHLSLKPKMLLVQFLEPRAMLP